MRSTRSAYSWPTAGPEKPHVPVYYDETFGLPNELTNVSPAEVDGADDAVFGGEVSSEHAATLCGE